MIRPITVICWILALGAGLYLYRAKHEVELMDKHIDQIAKQTSDLRAESRRMLDDWIRLGEPEQLHKYSNEYLGLKTIAPGQFARLSDLAARLPAPRADPPAEQPDLVAQSGGSSPGDGSPGSPSSGILFPGILSSDVPAAGTDGMNEADAEELPVPPIPPAAPAMVTAVSVPAVTAPPLQARPVTPRLTSIQPEPEVARPRPATPARVADEPRPATPARVADEPRAATRSTPVTLANPHQGSPGQADAVLAPSVGQTRGLPPLPARGQANFQGLPPLQAQASGQWPAQGPGRGPAQGQANGQTFGQASGLPALRSAELRNDVRANEPQREARPMQPWPMQAQPMDPRGSGSQVARQAAAQVLSGPPAPGGSLLGNPGGRSLLGSQRGPVPLPLPAPTQVNATWSGPSGTGR